MLNPSPTYRGWPGTAVKIRVWEICPKDEPVYRRCTQEEAKKLEELLGEWKSITFFKHPTLGEVCCER